MNSPTIPTEKRRATAGWVAVCVACVGAFEGLRTVAYRDPVGIPTICFGETAGVRLGDKKTAAECMEMLGDRVLEFGAAVDMCVATSPLPPERKAAYVSFAYNVGTRAFCSSTLVKLENAGKPVEACNQLPRWNKAKGIVLPGLVARREAERVMCMTGLM